MIKWIKNFLSNPIVATKINNSQFTRNFQQLILNGTFATKKIFLLICLSKALLIKMHNRCGGWIFDWIPTSPQQVHQKCATKLPPKLPYLKCNFDDFCSFRINWPLSKFLWILIPTLSMYGKVNKNSTSAYEFSCVAKVKCPCNQKIHQKACFNFAPSKIKW